MGKYDDIDRARQLLAAKNKLDAWRDLSQEDKAALYEAQTNITGNKRNNVGKQIGYIRPFGVEPIHDIWLKVLLISPATSTNTPRQESQVTLITNISELIFTGSTGTTLYGTLTKPAASGVHINDYTGKNDISKVARFTLRKKGDRLENRIASRVTGMLYTYTRSESVSCAFGQLLSLTDVQSFAGACNTIETAAKAKDSTYTCSFRAQGAIKVEVVEV